MNFTKSMNYFNRINITTTTFMISLFMFLSCSFNQTFTNEETLKVQADKVLDQYYECRKENTLDQNKQLFSNKFFTVMTPEKFIQFIEKMNNENGEYLGREMVSWQSNRVKGSNPVTEVLLRYNVNYTNGTVGEQFYFVEENDKLKIQKVNIDL